MNLLYFVFVHNCVPSSTFYQQITWKGLNFGRPLHYERIYGILLVIEQKELKTGYKIGFRAYSLRSANPIQTRNVCFQVSFTGCWAAISSLCSSFSNSSSPSVPSTSETLLKTLFFFDMIIIFYWKCFVSHWIFFNCLLLNNNSDHYFDLTVKYSSLKPFHKYIWKE